MIYKQREKVLIDNIYFERYHNDWSKKYFIPLIRKEHNCCIGIIAYPTIINNLLLSVDLVDTMYLSMYVYPMWFLRKPKYTDMITIPIDYLHRLNVDTEEDLTKRLSILFNIGV